ncbi:hypothetical protein GCM10007916_05270 [Psychromonas marina]|uniref:Flagellar hook-length control protein-like C-terminal domain-containing protein n=1 Tax=Psychromonas marina TaxID=88364 RepID=A0ABQ6DWU5_9GAMM|nr:flagellar hook-length control protein FliK [Psychromonas marina]GLS89460.1 hypothetical protein GCM10007916_05270 [Psychromonas marina]
MQSILSTSPTKLLATEKNHADKEAHEVEHSDKTGEENTAQRFSSVLSDLTDNKALIKSTLSQTVQQQTVTGEAVLEQTLVEETPLSTKGQQLDQQASSDEVFALPASEEQLLVNVNDNDNHKDVLQNITELSSNVATSITKKEPISNIESSDEQVVKAIKQATFSQTSLPANEGSQSALIEPQSNTDLAGAMDSKEATEETVNTGDTMSEEIALPLLPSSEKQNDVVTQEVKKELFASANKVLNQDVVGEAADKTEKMATGLNQASEMSNKEPIEQIAKNESTDNDLAESGVKGLVLDADPLLEEQLVTDHQVSNKTFAVSSNDSTDATDHQSQPSKVINPILSQIENAQKIDTQVTDPKTKLDADIAAKTTEAAPAFEKKIKLNTDNMGSDAVQVTDENTPKESNQSSNKLDSLISSLNQEMAKSTPPQNIENNGLRSIAATAVSDRMLQQTTHNTPLMQSAALQQPLELQSKQASAMIGERLMMMMAQGKQEVTIRLDPAELGSMHIKLQIQQDQLQVAIQTQAGQSRDIVEQNLPRLREQLAQQGINLGEATVEQQSKQEQSSSQHSGNGSVALQGGRDGTEQGLDDQGEWMSTQIPIPAQGIDYYA